jgi:hypothetical protein
VVQREPMALKVEGLTPDYTDSHPKIPYMKCVNYDLKLVAICS